MHIVSSMSNWISWTYSTHKISKSIITKEKQGKMNSDRVSEKTSKFQKGTVNFV